MSWVDAISDALGAVGSYVPQMERIQQQRKQLALDQIEQQRRNEALEFEQLNRSIVPGQRIDPTLMPKVIKHGLKGRVRASQDGLFWADTMDDTLARERLLTQQGLTKEASVKAEMAQKELDLRKQIEANPQMLFSQPYEKQSLLWQQAGFGGQAPMSFEEYERRQKANDFLPYLASQARISASQTPDAMESLRMQKLQLDLLKEKFGVQEASGIEYIPNDKGQVLLNQYKAAKQQLLAGGAQAPAPAQAAQPTGRKYQIVGVR